MFDSESDSENLKSALSKAISLVDDKETVELFEKAIDVLDSKESSSDNQNE